MQPLSERVSSYLGRALHRNRSGYALQTERKIHKKISTISCNSWQVLIRRSKADPFGEGRLAFTLQKTAGLGLDWLDWRGPEIKWLFRPIYQSYALNRILDTTNVKRLVINAAWRAALDQSNTDAFRGHSLRLGPAQYLVVKGYDTVVIMRAGGWKSVGVLARYLEKAEHNVWGLRLFSVILSLRLYFQGIHKY